MYKDFDLLLTYILTFLVVLLKELEWVDRSNSK